MAAARFSKAINVAGSYPYRCTNHSMTGTIKVRIQVSPTSGSVGTIFTVAVASVAAPTGVRTVRTGSTA